MPSRTLVELVAQRSFDWKDEFRFTFIWNNNFIIGNYDRNRRWLSILTQMGQEEKAEAVAWLERFILKKLLEEEEDEVVEKKGKEEEDEEDRD